MFELLSNGKCKADVHGSLIYEGSGIVFTNFSITNPTDKHAKATDQPTTRGIWSDRGLPCCCRSTLASSATVLSRAATL